MAQAERSAPTGTSGFWDFWKSGGLAGLLGMEPWDVQARRAAESDNLLDLMMVAPGFDPATAGKVAAAGIISRPPASVVAAVNRAASEAKGLTQPALRRVYGDVGLVTGEPSPVARPALADQPAEAVEAARKLKLADLDVLKDMTQAQRQEAYAKGRMPSQVWAREQYEPMRSDLAKATRRIEDEWAGMDPVTRGLFDVSPERLNTLPDAPQFALPRVDPATTERLAAAQRGGGRRLDRATRMGGPRATGWYWLDQVREDMLREHGPELGEQMYDMLLDSIAGTSMINPLPNNLKAGSYYFREGMQGRPVPQTVPLINPYTGKSLQVLAGAPPPPYGAKAAPQHASRVREFMSNQMDPVANPKPISYRYNLGGNWLPTTVDTHEIRNQVGMPRGILDFRENAGLLPKEYSFMERVGERSAQRLGLTPAQRQAGTWIGGGEYTGLKSPPVPALEELDRRIFVTSKIRGVPPEQVYQELLRGEEALF